MKSNNDVFVVDLEVVVRASPSIDDRFYAVLIDFGSLACARLRPSDGD